MITIDPEFKALIPPLLPEERKGLEESILKEGCRDALVVWKGHNILVDGHNRYEICTAHGKPFETVEMEFASRDDAMVWIIDNQFSRRNLTPFIRGELALKRKHIIAAKAKKNQAQYFGNQYQSGLLENSPKVHPINTRAEVAKIAGVSHDTIARVHESGRCTLPFRGGEHRGPAGWRRSGFFPGRAAHIGARFRIRARCAGG